MPHDFKYINGFGTRYKLYPDGRVISASTGKLMSVKIVGNNKCVFLFDGEKYYGRTIYKLIQSHFSIEPDQPHKIESIEGEEWAPIPNFEDAYMISTHGRVKAINVTYHGERLLKPTKHRRGYYSVSLSSDNNKESFIICNLMGKVFLPNPHNHKMVIHLDGDKTNNHISNLKWVHNSEAQKLAVDLGLKPILWGEENPTSVAVNQYTPDGCTLIRS